MPTSNIEDQEGQDTLTESDILPKLLPEINNYLSRVIGWTTMDENEKEVRREKACTTMACRDAWVL